jgi:hypothetical protein
MPFILEKQDIGAVLKNGVQLRPGGCGLEKDAF